MSYAAVMPFTQQVSCPKCVELWREYAEATRQHVQLIKEQERREDSRQATKMEPEIDLASVRRDSARAGIRIHLAVDHAQPSLTVAVAG
jgi:hypothetical protein